MATSLMIQMQLTQQMTFLQEKRVDFCRKYSTQSFSFSYICSFFTLCFLIVCFLIIHVVAPQITTQPHGELVTEGDNVTLSCNVSGVPAPSITWTKDGSVLTSSFPRISFGAESSELTITSVKRTDSGEYRCVANNSVANATSDAATLDVQCEYTS